MRIYRFARVRVASTNRDGSIASTEQNKKALVSDGGVVKATGARCPILGCTVVNGGGGERRGGGGGGGGEGSVTRATVKQHGVDPAHASCTSYRCGSGRGTCRIAAKFRLHMVENVHLSDFW